MAELQQPENSADSPEQTNPTSTNVGRLNVGGNVGENVIVGNNNVFNYYATVQKNVEKHEPDYWALKHPYPMPPNFTGRIQERATLTHWLKEDSENRLFILRALGGFGKSALTWHWLTHDVDIKEYPKVVFWSFYEGDASFEHFIEETLKYLKLEVPQGQRPQVDALLNAMGAQKILLIMDGFERLLRGYSNMNASHQGDQDKKLIDADRDCVNLDSEHFLKSICSMPNLKSKALMTTRMTPRALEKFGQFIQGCREEELKAMQKNDAIAFFRAQGVHKGTNHEIEEVCKLYGFHPLSLRLLVGHIMTSLKNRGDIVVAQNIKVSGDVMEHQNHILEVAYNGLPPRQQKLLRTMACFRSSTKLDILESIAENKDSLEEDLQDLIERGLVQFDKQNTIFDLHPIVRRYAYDRLTATDRTGAHERLVNYFEAVPKPEQVQTLEDLAPVIELYHHLVRAGKLDEARTLFRDHINAAAYYQFGAYQLQIELLHALFLDGEDKPQRLKDESAQAWTLNSLAASYFLSGQPRRAADALAVAIPIVEKLGEKRNVARGLGNVAIQQIAIGALSTAERNLHRRIGLSREIADEFSEAVGHGELGGLLIYRGELDEAERELFKAKKFFEDTENYDGLCVIYCYQCSRLLQMKDSRKALLESQNAFKAWEEDAKKTYPTIRTLVRTQWLIGASYRFDGQSNFGERHLNESLSHCRAINMIDYEANILLDLARLRYDQRKYEEAKSLADEALLITERCGYILQGADVNLFLAQYALEQEKDKAKAKEYAETALKLAYCDGPPYYYKVAYHEAERFLEKL